LGLGLASKFWKKSFTSFFSPPANGAVVLTDALLLVVGTGIAAPETDAVDKLLPIDCLLFGSDSASFSKSDRFETIFGASPDAETALNKNNYELQFVKTMNCLLVEMKLCKPFNHSCSDSIVAKFVS
jgi:hypothetical protein